MTSRRKQVLRERVVRAAMKLRDTIWPHSVAHRLHEYERGCVTCEFLRACSALAASGKKSGKKRKGKR